jgi:hypothetical protein
MTLINFEKVRLNIGQIERATLYRENDLKIKKLKREQEKLKIALIENRADQKEILDLSENRILQFVDKKSEVLDIDTIMSVYKVEYADCCILIPQFDKKAFHEKYLDIYEENVSYKITTELRQ